MNLDALFRFLLWSLVANYCVLITWFLAFVMARSWIKRLHGRWFHLGDSAFDAIHYGGMAAYKIGILLLNIAPLVALLAIRHGG